MIYTISKGNVAEMLILQRLNLIVLLVVMFSLASLHGMSGVPQFPSLPLARANLQASNELWYPSGPAMDRLFEPMYATTFNEFNDIQSPSPNIDLMDTPLPPALKSTFVQSPNFLVTRGEWVSFNELEFNLASNFWGCQFRFGVTPCGIDIRQGIAHLIDKNLFAVDEGDISGSAAAIDNPLSAGSTLPTPNPCNWDPQFGETGSQCVVGGTIPGSRTTPYTGGAAYHLASATGACVPSPSSPCSIVPWMQNNPSPDFCAGARDIGAGLNMTLSAIPPGMSVLLANPPAGTFPSGSPSGWTFNSSTDCHLVLCCGAQPSDNILHASQMIGSNPVNLFYRTDNLALQTLGLSFAEEICAVWGAGFINGCNSVSVPGWPTNPMNILDLSKGNPQVFPGYSTSIGSSPTTNWGIYTAGAGTFHPLNLFTGDSQRLGQLQCIIQGGCDPFDINLYFTFNSQFVSGISSIKPPTGTCSSAALPSGLASNYMYLCDTVYDNLSNQMEFASCVGSSTNNDVDTQSGVTTPTFRDCNGNAVPPSTQSLTALSAGLQAEARFGQGAYAIPMYTTSVEYGFLNNGWSRVINSGGTFNYFTWLNTRNPSPVNQGTIRQGLSTSVHSLNPYIASFASDFAILGGVYDSLEASNPYAQDQFIDWMIINAAQLSNGSLGYTPPAGTATTYRLTLRDDLNFQDGNPVTSFDVAFSYLTLLSTGSSSGATLQNLVGIRVLSAVQFDINVNSYGPFTIASITSPPVLSARYWTSQSAGGWDQASAKCTQAGASCYPVQYTFSSGSETCVPTNCSIFGTNFMQVPLSKIDASYDPVSNHIFVGSGPWQCGITVDTAGSGTCSSTLTMNVGAGGSYTFQRFGEGLPPASSGVYFRSSGNLALWIWSKQGGANSFLNFSALAVCFNQPVNLAGPCAHWQQGIGNPGTGSAVGVSQAGIVIRFYALNWVAPFDWASQSPYNIGLFPPVLYDGTTTLNPATVAGCTSAYPTGGYDC